MKPETIKAIFTNLLFVIGVILLIWGVSKAALTVSRFIVFDKYPLAGYDETRCDNNAYAYVKPVTSPEMADSRTPEQIETERENCISGVEKDRKNREVEDIVQSVVLPLSGLILIYFFRKFILK